MAYHALLDKSSSTSSLEDSMTDDLSPIARPEAISRTLSGKFWHLSIANLVLLVLQVVLLTVHIGGQWLPLKPNLIQSSYGFNSNYMTLDHGYDWLWQDPAIEKAGSIVLKRDEEGEVIEYGVISMFHQLHCVASIRSALQRAYEGGIVAFNQTEDRHWPHCLHYLHQMIMCNADSQIEQQQLFNNTIPFVSGAEDMRQCHDAEHLFDMFESMQT